MSIQTKFVTSFSELYLGLKVDATYGTDDGTKINAWFSVPTAPAASAATVAVDARVKIVNTSAGSDYDVYFLNDTSADIVLATTDCTVKGLLEKGLSVEYCKIPLLAEIGSLSNEATVIDVPEFGERFKGKLRGQLDGGQLDTTLYWAPRESAHLLIRELAANGKGVAAGVRWLPDDVAGTKGELVVFNSFVSSFGIDTAFDDVAKVNSTLVVDGAEYFAEE
jgi:hypothetical protein